MQRTCYAILVGCLLAGCGKADPQPPASAAATAATAAAATAAPSVAASAPVAMKPPQAVAAAVAAAAPAPTAADPYVGVAQTIEGVPPLALAPVGVGVSLRAGQKNGAGVKMHRKKKYDKAIDAYLSALRLDPGHLLARYNLACAFALTGRIDDALALLRQLREAGCPLCLDRLQRAVADSDFAACRGDPRFAALTTGVEVIEPDYHAAMLTILAANSRQRSAAFEASLRAGVAVEYHLTEEDLTGETDGKQPVRRWTTQKEIKRLDAITWPEANSEITCQKRCCKVAVMCGGAEDVSTNIEAVCFRPKTATEALPVRVDAFTCGGH